MIEDKRRRPHGKLILMLDFDGCIHSYSSGWLGINVIPDPPVPGVFEWIANALDYFEIHVYSARSADHSGIKAMYEYCIQHGGLPLAQRLRYVDKKSSCHLTIDDRSVRFDGDWLDPRFDPQELLRFKSWYQLEK